MDVDIAKWTDKKSDRSYLDKQEMERDTARCKSCGEQMLEMTILLSW